MRLTFVAVLENTFLRWLPLRLQLTILNGFSQLRRNIIGPYGDGILVNSLNGRLLISSSDFVVGRSLAFAGHYGKENLWHLLSMISAESNVLIVGAHVGTLLVPLAKKARWVVGIEANPETFSFLQMNMKLNDLTNVELREFAAWNARGEVEFLISHHNTGGSKVVWKSLDSLFYYDAPDSVKVPMRRIDDELPDREFDLVVMDVEGSEYYALEGMQRVLEKCRALQVEVSQMAIERVAKISPAKFVEPIKPHFDKAMIIDEKENVKRPVMWEKREFETLINSLCHSNECYNVLFMKEAGGGHEWPGL